MKYVLADRDKAIMTGFDRETHNCVKIENKTYMVITAKGMMNTDKIVGDEKIRLTQLNGIMFNSQKELDSFLRNYNIR